MQTYTIRGKKVTIHNDGEIFINGSKTGLKQWQSDRTRYSNLSGQEQREIKGLDIEKALLRIGKV
ncbi:MAG: hypothetical protein HWE20_03870 [Gammaproteobacteria bacterium]|nr:hypothetical protein [Gammaproteobacteria bacterium]